MRASGSGMPTLVSMRTACWDSSGSSRLGMRPDDVDELTADRDQRIERRLGILDNQPDLASSDLLQGAVRLSQQITRLEL